MRITFQYLLPHRLISLLAGWCANCKIVWIKNYLISYFIKRYAVNMQEAVQSDPFAYATYNDFFTRALKPECRPLLPGPTAIVSPADGLVAQFGDIKQQQLLQAKGHYFSVQDLVGGSALDAAPFENGKFATIYLAPKDYHRVHMPYTGHLTKMIYVPGSLFSVNIHAAENIPNLFARNERVVTLYDTSAGKMAVILVGAMIVGSIETVWAGTITPPHGKKTGLWRYKDQHELIKGSEMGRFKLGSTVIVLFENNKVTLEPTLRSELEVKVGQRIATVNGKN